MKRTVYRKVFCLMQVLRRNSLFERKSEDWLLFCSAPSFMRTQVKRRCAVWGLEKRRRLIQSIMTPVVNKMKHFSEMDCIHS